MTDEEREFVRMSRRELDAEVHALVYGKSVQGIRIPMPWPIGREITIGWDTPRYSGDPVLATDVLLTLTSEGYWVSASYYPEENQPWVVRCEMPRTNMQPRYLRSNSWSRAICLAAIAAKRYEQRFAAAGREERRDPFDGSFTYSGPTRD